MPTYEELLPATRSCPRGAGIRWTPSTAGHSRGTLVVNSNRKLATYEVTEFPACEGRAFRLVKVAGGTDPESDSYSVFIPNIGSGSLCECKGFERFGHCKHVASLRAILENLDLWSRCTASNADAALAELLQNLGLTGGHWSDGRDAAKESADEAAFIQSLCDREHLLATAVAPEWLVSGEWFTVHPQFGSIVETWRDRRRVLVRLATDADEVARVNGRLSSYNRPRI